MRWLWFIGFIFLFTIPGSASLITIESKTVHVGDVFSLNITLAPSEPVKAWEFRLHTGSLTLLNIGLGGFFGDRPVFSVMNGSVAYALTIGPGLMVNTTGVLCVAWVKAEAEGMASVTLSDAGITNDTKYLNLGVEEGAVTILSPPWSPVGEGWSVFQNRFYSQEGWNTFGQRTLERKGWNRFQATMEDQNDALMMFVCMLVGLCIALFTAAMMFIVGRQGRK